MELNELKRRTGIDINTVGYWHESGALTPTDPKIDQFNLWISSTFGSYTTRAGLGLWVSLFHQQGEEGDLSISFLTMFDVTLDL